MEVAHFVAVPAAGALLADLGADVIKVQTEERATLVNQPDYPYYPVWNRSKRSVTLDFKHPGAPGMARRLMERADVVIEAVVNFGTLPPTGHGTITFTAANGDKLVANFTGSSALVVPGLVLITEHSVIDPNQSTGRFAGATGTIAVAGQEVGGAAAFTGQVCTAD